MIKTLLFKCAMTLMAFTAIVSADIRPPKVAVMLSPDKRTQNEYKFSLKKLGWTADYYACTVEAHKELASKLADYDFIMSTSLFNISKDHLPKGSMAKAKFLKYLNEGGILIVVDAAYQETRNWIGELGPDFAGLKNGKCNSSDWQVLGSTYDATPAHSMRFFPNKITCGNNWPHFHKLDKNSKWKNVAFCSEGFPVTVAQDVGQGMILVSALTHPTAEQLQNYYANALLRKNGLKLKSFSISPLQVGRGKIKMELGAALNNKAKLFYLVTDDKNRSERFEADIDGTVCELDYEINKRGSVTASLGLSLETGDVRIFSKSTKLPELITLHNSSYRGILSTKRRLPDVKFDVDIAVIDEDLTNTKLVLKVLNAQGKSVSTVKHEFTTKKIPSKLSIAVPMDKALEAGEYTVRAELIAAKGKFNGTRSEVKIKIFDPHPAQTIIDEDRTFLVDGKPFFPMGIYHVTPKDYPRMKEIGFNTVQFWMWDNSQDKDGKLIAASKAHENGLKLIVEGLHAENFDMRVNTLGKHPAMLMWYAFDELNERRFGEAKKMTALYNKDEQHPVYGLSCRPDLFKRTSKLIDTFAYNAGTNAEAYRIVGRGTHKATIYVPSSFSDAIPDPKTMRFEAYDGLVHDVRGIMWYCWYQIGGGPIGRGLHNSEKHQKVVQQVCQEVKIMEAGLTSSTRRPFKVNDGVNGYVCGEQNGERYLIMMNHTDKAIDVSYTVDELSKVSKVRDPFIKDKSMNIEIKDGMIKKTFQAKEILVYNW